MINSRYNLHTESLFKSLDILKVEDILHLQMLKFDLRYYNKNIPEFFLNLGLKEKAEVHAYLTRNCHTTQVERPHSELARKSLKFGIAHILNNTPILVTDKVQTHSFHGFRT